ncbi:MAG TPA: hypothetical protein VNM40_03625 [Candidatus Paceibacterota bacterium]|nr:hypothetical protein [Candidatus Paceibacterota bacterium]
MSWASRRQATYLFGVVLFVGVLVTLPLAYWYFNLDETCFDGVQNQTETAVDKGGPCKLLDERTLTPHAVLWTRAFSVRDGSYSAVAFVENPNESAGVVLAPYRFRLYDDRNVLVAEREGATYVMPGTVTPVYEGAIDTGNRKVARAYFEFMAPLVWERLYDATRPIVIETKQITDPGAMPRLTAIVHNTGVTGFRDTQFVAVVYDTAGNAFAASATVVPVFGDGERKEIVFTWPDPFPYLPGRTDVIPLLEPRDRP